MAYLVKSMGELMNLEAPAKVRQDKVHKYNIIMYIYLEEAYTILTFYELIILLYEYELIILYYIY